MMNNIDKIYELFPNCIVETADAKGNLIRSIDFDKLRLMLGDEVIDDKAEHFDFTWVGKNNAIRKANERIDKTLRPCIEDSVNWNTTNNLYIEGDNFDVLKLLQNSYFGKVKMIYIDPPYNTGKDFIYHDKLVMNKQDYDEQTEQFNDDDDKTFVENKKVNPRFHSDWCSMIYPRLILARNLLSDDGVIFISIDDNEQANLKKICDEVFGEKNFIAQIIWERAYAPVNLKKHFSESHDYIICYSKNLEITKCNGLPRTGTADDRYKNPDNDPRGVWESDNLSVGPAVESKVYEIITPSGRKVFPPKGYCWRLDKKTFQKYVEDNRIWFGENGDIVPRIKRFLSEVKQSVTPMTIWKYAEVGHSQDATKFLKNLFDNESVFTYPKPVDLIKRCLELYSDKNSIVMDFFSGSATTAHAVMQLNAEDGGNRKFIMVQLPEICAENTEAYKAGYKNICEIGKERIRRAAKKISEDNPNAKFDDGFRVFKTADSNYKDIYFTADEYNQEMLFELNENIKPERTDLDLLFDCVLKLGLPLSMTYDTLRIEDYIIHIYDDGKLTACFDKNITESAFKQIAQRKPQRVVFRDSSFSDSAAKINVFEIFKLISPETDIKVL